MLNPFAFTRGYSRISNIITMPIFRVLPLPPGYILVTTTGRTSGRPRRRPIRAVRDDGTYYGVAILGEQSDWLKNVRATPEVQIKAGMTTRRALAREVTDASERERAASRYAGDIYAYDYLDHVSLHWGFPTRRHIKEAHEAWLKRGLLVAFDLQANE